MPSKTHRTGNIVLKLKKRIEGSEKMEVHEIVIDRNNWIVDHSVTEVKFSEKLEKTTTRNYTEFFTYGKENPYPHLEEIRKKFFEELKSLENCTGCQRSGLINKYIKKINEYEENNP